VETSETALASGLPSRHPRPRRRAGDGRWRSVCGEPTCRSGLGAHDRVPPGEQTADGLPIALIMPIMDDERVSAATVRPSCQAAQSDGVYRCDADVPGARRPGHALDGDSGVPALVAIRDARTFSAAEAAASRRRCRPAAHRHPRPVIGSSCGRGRGDGAGHRERPRLLSSRPAPGRHGAAPGRAGAHPHSVGHGHRARRGR
jgi:hypothetical protein